MRLDPISALAPPDPARVNRCNMLLMFRAPGCTPASAGPATVAEVNGRPVPGGAACAACAAHFGRKLAADAARAASMAARRGAPKRVGASRGALAAPVAAPKTAAPKTQPKR